VSFRLRAGYLWHWHIACGAELWVVVRCCSFLDEPTAGRPKFEDILSVVPISITEVLGVSSVILLQRNDCWVRFAILGHVLCFVKYSDSIKSAEF
jgi:hypothetical protein